jgi:hypothetical protein
MKRITVAAVGVLAFAGCVTVNLPEIPPYHPGYAQAETGAVAPAPPILDLSTAPPTASPGLPVPAPPDSEPGTIRSDEAGETPMTGNIHREHGMMQHDGMQHQGPGQQDQQQMQGMDHSKHREGAPAAKPAEPAPDHGGMAGNVAYTCPMHPEVVSDRPGNCPKCGMLLHKKEAQK